MTGLSPATRLRLGAVLAAIVAGVIVASLGAGAAPPDASDVPAASATGYDHLRHEARVSVALAPAIPCTRCHLMNPAGRVIGRPGHGACFGDCHGPGPRPRRPGRRYSISAEQRPYCVVCHAPADLDNAQAGKRGALSVSYPPYQNDPDHGLALSHQAHQEPARDRGDCTLCHAVPGQIRSQRDRGHEACTACHPATPATPAAPEMQPGDKDTKDKDTKDKDTNTAGPPAMNQCLQCHTQAFGPRTRPFLVRGRVPVSATFSHQAHLARGARDCRTCHGEIALARDSELPAPTMASCQSCHDGNTAFSVLGPHCRRCHTTPDSTSTLRARLEARYDHEAHRAHLDDETCTRCHTLDARAVPRPPAADHAPCSDAGCHRDQFSARKPTICGACHVGVEPWRPLHFDRPPRPDTQFGARFSHRAHLGERAMKRTCADCHNQSSPSRDKRLSRDHTSCTGAGCHTVEQSAAPSLSECRGCHTMGLGKRREFARKRVRWSVRAQFRHQGHERAPGTGRPLSCTQCHTGVEFAQTMDDIPTPAKSTCTPCHDGQQAFKVTGHGCARCHGDSRSGNP